MKVRAIVLTAAMLLSVNVFAQSNQFLLPIREGQPPQGDPLAGGIYMTPGLCGIFHTWGFVGDSLCSGELESIEKDGKKGYHDIYEYSWGQRMCAYMGATGDNYSVGGETAEGWIRRFWAVPNNKNNNIDAKITPKQAYIIALMANDMHRGYPAGDVDTDVDIDDYTKNSKVSFAGNYAGIIQRLKSIQPDAKFFVVTSPASRKAVDYNAVVRKMADIFENVYVIDLEKYSPDYADPGFISANFTGGHMNAIGYEFTAWMFLNYIDWIIRSRPEEFQETGFIGRHHTFAGTNMLYNGLPAKTSSETDIDTFIQQYKKNKAEWDAAFDFLKRDDLKTLAPGRYELTERGTYANIQELTTSKENPKKDVYERHEKYVDIQYMLEGEELIYISDLDSMKEKTREYDAENDYELYTGSTNPRPVVMNDTTFVVAFPGQPHHPGLAPQGTKPAKAKKVVVKVIYSK